MFHAHQSEFTELGWMGFFEVVEADGAPRGARRPRSARRLAALGARADPAARASSSACSSRRRLVARRPDRREPAAGRRVRRAPRRVPAGRDPDRVRNPQSDDLTIALVTVDDAIVPFTLDGPPSSAACARARSSCPIRLGRRRADRGRDHQLDRHPDDEQIAAAVETPRPSRRGFLGYALIGFLVGVVPIALGLLWLPSLRRADARWLAAFLALTAGLLTFLGVEALSRRSSCRRRCPARSAAPASSCSASPRAASA